MREHIVEGPFAAGRASTSSIVSGVSYTRTAMMHDEVETAGEIVASSAPGAPGLL